jgi:hypothetical protein
LAVLVSGVLAQINFWISLLGVLTLAVFKMAPPTLLYTLGSCTGIFQPILTYKPILDLQNDVNIQDDDFTFIYPSVWALSE